MTNKPIPTIKADDNALISTEGDAIAELEKDLENLKNDRNEERFLLTVVIIVFANVLFFSIIDNWAGALVVGAIEIFGLAVLARRWDIEEVAQIISKFLDRAADQTKKS